MSETLRLGLDIGSISVNTVLLDHAGQILEDHYDYCHGRPFHVLKNRIADILARHGHDAIQSAAFTGTGGALAARLIGGVFVNEIVAQAASVCRLYPDAHTIIEMGGEDTKLIFLRDGALSDFVMNSICAAGTGSFLDQQARRINVPLEGEFGRLALLSKDPPRIAGRCSVFAKSDMIHLQQIATPVHDIIAGLCFAVARNVKSTLARGRDLVPPVIFQGGVAANAGMVRALGEVFGLAELVVPPHHASMGALGALFHAETPEAAAESPAFRGLDELEAHLESPGANGDNLAALDRPRRTPCLDTVAPDQGAGASRREVSLGVDVGSLSTNVVLIDSENQVVARRYLPTAGRPLEAVQRGVREIGEEVGDSVVVRAVGTTGSGRYLTGDFVGADTIINEITAQATAAVSIDPAVDTIFEIGGQDSKYISVDNGVVVDFEMNKVCAAGTGSFLEEQAEKLGVQIVGEFGERALEAGAPAKLGDRCTVFMESDLNSRQQKGTGRDNLIAGLAYSIVQNYLTKVVGERPVGKRIFFQGGVAYNAAVVSAFGKVVGRDVTVPPHFDVTGAIGAAMLARGAVNGNPTRFKGFEVGHKEWSVDLFTCGSCANQCQVRRVRVKGEPRPLYYGGRCERYEVPERKDRGKGTPDLFQERTRMLLDGWAGEEGAAEVSGAARGPVIGIPRALSVFYQRFPFWRTFFEALGMRVVLSRPTDQALVAASLETLTAETCFPVEVMHGHVLDLLERGVDGVFLPFVVNEEADADNPTSNCNCPWIQTYPFMVRGCAPAARDAEKLLVPTLHFRYSRRLLLKELGGFMGERFGTAPADVARALGEAFRAQGRFNERVRTRGAQVMSSLPEGKVPVVILGRPYNTGDPGLNLRIVDKLISLDVLPIPTDFLPLAGENIFAQYPSMYWPNGRRILQAARIVARDPRLQAVYLGNFRCGPDSFLTHYVREEMRGKPWLQVEMDEHSADAGLITRLEAFLDSLRGRAAHQARQAPEAAPAPAVPAVPAARSARSSAPVRMLYFPAMADGAHALAAACRACGVPADVLPPLEERDLALGRAHTSSRECFPMICTTGSFLRKLQEPGVDTSRISFFMPDHNGPCRFGQYNKLQRMILDRLGFNDVTIVHPTNDDSYAGLVPGKGVRFRLAVWRGIIAVDILRKLLQERAPYEARPGATLEIYKEQLARVTRCVERGGWGIEAVVAEAVSAFDRVELRAAKRKPVVAVIGEIYMRDNPFCNGYVVRRLEALGAETYMGPVRDWVSYSTHRYTRDSKRKGKTLGWMKSRLQGFFQDLIEERLVHIAAHGGVEMHRDIPLARMMELAAPYVHRDYDGDPVLALGGAAGQAGSGISGVVNILPFTCLPGTLISAVSPRFCEDHDGLPWVNIAYDGQEDAALQTRLQAFVYRTQEFAHSHGFDRERAWRDVRRQNVR